MDEKDTLRVDSRRWTGDMPPSAAAPAPPLTTAQAAEKLRAVMGPLCVALAMLAAYYAIARIPAGFGMDYAVAVAPWHDGAARVLTAAMLALTAILIASNWFAFPRWTGRSYVWAAMLILGLVAVDFYHVREAHRHARAVGPRAPMLMANTDGCGREFGGRGGGRYRPGPCSHQFEMMGRDGRPLIARGYGMAHVRSCALTQRMEDGAGFVWYRIVAQQRFPADPGSGPAFSPEAAQACLSGQMTSRFALL
jgi:hypothetical protein